MKKSFISAVSLCVLCVLSGSHLAQEFRTVRDGVEYAQVTREFKGKPVRMDLLRLDPKKVRLDLHHALDSVIGTETTSAIAKRHGAVAAVNAGFFRLDRSAFLGDPSGLFVVDGKLLSESTNGRSTLLIRNRADRTEVSIDRLNWNYQLSFYDRTARKQVYVVASGINRERRDNELVIYTPEFGPRTLTPGGGLEVVMRDNGRPEVFDGAGSSEIPKGGFVISASGTRKSELRDLLARSRGASRPVLVTNRIVDGQPKWMRYDSDRSSEVDVIAGVPQLIRNGRIDITWEQEKAARAFVENRHPRTAAAKLKDGKLLLLTADGRSETSAGLDLYDLAAYLLELGAVDAINLDGGGSTTMYLDGKVVNRPSDPTGERKVSDALVVTMRQRSPKR